jgi:hypothetical protein
MSPRTHASRKVEHKPLKPSEVIATIRDLIVYLHRGNVTQAEPIVTNVAAYLNEILISGGDPETPEMQRAQQTMFAIDEVRTLLGQRDFDGAATAARDAANEWKHKAAKSAATLD